MSLLMYCESTSSHIYSIITVLMGVFCQKFVIFELVYITQPQRDHCC